MERKKEDAPEQLLPYSDPDQMSRGCNCPISGENFGCSGPMLDCSALGAGNADGNQHNPCTYKQPINAHICSGAIDIKNLVRKNKITRNVGRQGSQSATHRPVGLADC